MALRDPGTREADIPRVAELTVANPHFNPRPVTRAALLPLFHDAGAVIRPAG